MAGVAPIYWGPTELSTGFDFTFAPGIEPSICNLYTIPHVDSLPNVATLTFYQRDDAGSPINTFAFPNCLLEAPRLNFSPQGNFWTLPILDRRWMWRYGWIKGSYNVPEPDGITYRRERTPQELATLLLEAMNETGYDVSRLPTDDNARPHVEWSGGLPASELASLCALFDCIVVLNPLTNKVEIWPEGTGAASPPLPTDQPIEGAGFAAVYPSQPFNVKCEAANTLFQITFQCEAVGKDTNGVWKPIDELSYKPDEGWSPWWPPKGFPFIEGTYADGARTLRTRDLAHETVFRCYRITGIVGGGWAVPLLAGTDLEPTKLKDDFRLFDTLAEEEVSSDDGGLRPLTAVAFAKRFRSAEEELEQPDDPLRYPYGVELDTVHGIITFPSPIFEYDDALNTVSPSTVHFECSCYAGKDGIFHRASVGDATGSEVITSEYLIQRQEIQRRVIYHYDNAGDLGTTEDNQTDTENRLQYYLDAELARYGSQPGGTATYKALVPLSPDGLIEQITWSSTIMDGVTTTASAAQRHNRYVPSLDNQRHGVRVPKDQKTLTDLINDTKTNADIERTLVA